MIWLIDWLKDLIKKSLQKSQKDPFRKHYMDCFRNFSNDCFRKSTIICSLKNSCFKSLFGPYSINNWEIFFGKSFRNSFRNSFRDLSKKKYSFVGKCFPRISIEIRWEIYREILYESLPYVSSVILYLSFRKSSRNISKDVYGKSSTDSFKLFLQLIFRRFLKIVQRIPWAIPLRISSEIISHSLTKVSKNFSGSSTLVLSF